METRDIMKDNQIISFIRKQNMNLWPLGVSILLLLYFVLFLIPYADAHNFLQENLIPDDGEKLVYGFLSIPVMVIYLIYIIVFMNKVVFLRSIFYPLVIVNVYFGTFLCLIRAGGAVLWLMVFTILIPAVLVPLFFIFGLISDIRYYRKNKLS